MLKEHSLIVNSDQDGIRLDRLLFELFPVVSREVWKARISQQRVLVNQMTCKASRKLNAGDEIRFTFLAKTEPQVNTTYQFIDGFAPPAPIMAIHKPPDLPVHPSGIYHHNTLMSLLKKDFGNMSSFFLVNRLDRETSGIVLLASSAQICRDIQGLFKQNAVLKKYIVFVEGIYPDYQDATGYIAKSKNSLIRKKMEYHIDQNYFGFSEQAKLCRSEFSCIQKGSIAGKKISCLSVTLHTGRTHQIRATLCSTGFPVVGDRLYGIDENLYLKFINDEETQDDRQSLIINRTALHCEQMIFTSPIDGSVLQIDCPIPEDLQLLKSSILPL